MVFHDEDNTIVEDTIRQAVYLLSFCLTVEEAHDYLAVDPVLTEQDIFFAIKAAEILLRHDR